MGISVDYRHLTICDQCGREHLRYLDVEYEKTLPDKWSRLIIHTWYDGTGSTSTGTDIKYAELCDDCHRGLSITFRREN